MSGHTCPRRMTQFGPWPREEGLDDFKKGRCSFCGSASQEDFLQAIRDGKSIGPTDKSYKLYLSEPLTDEQKAERRQQQIGRYVGMGMSEDVASAEADKDTVLGEGAHLGKFYTHHLTDQALVDEFDALWGEGKINWGYPGRPYVSLALPSLPTRLQDAGA
jgi:hypothetical protein